MKKICGQNKEKGIVLITLYGMIIVMGILMASLYSMSFGEIQAVHAESSLIQALYLAEAGIDHQLASLNNGGTSSIGSYSLGQGTVNVVYDSVEDTVTSTGTVRNTSRTVTVTVQPLTLAITVDAALRVASNLLTNGSITIDGRDHDANGNLTGDPGTYGIKTTGSSYDQSGSSQVGGNGAAPASPYDPVAVQLNAPPIPPTPEEMLGLQAGALDAYKTSTPPSPNFTGIVYYTGDQWQPADFGTFSSGILIVHNTDGDALMKNVHGNFNGLIITDKLQHINGDVVVNGAIIAMTQDGNTIGNGDATVNYSSSVLNDLPGVGSYEITSWQDSHNN